jgi:phenylacetate-CoA ligase
MPSIYDRIYAQSPVWLQNLGVSAYGWLWRNRRFGGNFRRYVAEFSARERFSPAEWEAYQQSELRRLLLSAARSVPYYRDTFRALGLSADDLRAFTLADLRKLPVLPKETIRRQPERFVAEDIPPRMLNTYLTSGTTGTPLAIKFLTEMDRISQAAYEARVRRWAGVDYRMSRAMIGGRLVVPEGDARPPFWRYNLFEKQLYMSAFHISPANAPAYAAALNRMRPDYLVGYASSHFFLARMIAEQGIPMYSPRAILTSSEKLTPEMRATLENVYHTQVFDGYSGVEAVCQASECEQHSMHISPDMGIIEFLDDEDQPVPPGQPGHLVATGLLNFAHPLIRYQTGDLGILSHEPCACGRHMPVLKELVGRLEDTVIGRDGRETVRFHGIFVGLPTIVEGQVIQHTLSDLTLKLVVTPAFGEAERKILRQRFSERLGQVNLSFEYVDQIPRSAGGKFRAVISHVPRQAIPPAAGR